MSIFGAILVSIWGTSLVIETGKVLPDREIDHPVVQKVREAVEIGPDAGETQITDIHVWRVGKHTYSCALMLITHDQLLTPQRVREQFSQHKKIVNATIEIHVCPAQIGQYGPNRQTPSVAPSGFCNHYVTILVHNETVLF